MQKFEWMIDELNQDDYYPTEQDIADILAGRNHDKFIGSLIDYVFELEREWDEKLFSSTAA